MNDDEVAQTFAALRKALEMDDPDLRRRLIRLERRDGVNAAVVTTLLAIGAVLVATGLGATSFIVWALGLGALALAVVVDHTYQRRMRRTR